MILKQSTNYSRKFLMVLSTDHISGATGKTVAVELSKGPGAVGTTAANSPATELDSTNMPGWYQILLNPTDTANTGDLAIHCTATGCDPTDFVDSVQTTIFTDLLLASSGRAFIDDNLQTNSTQIITFQMVDSVTGAPKTGLTVTAQRCLGLSGFAACANAVVEIGNGIYGITLAPTDTNSSSVGLLFTATGAANLFISTVTTP